MDEEKPRNHGSVGIHIENCGSFRIGSGSFSNIGTGIKVTNSSGTAGNLHFHNVDQPVAVDGGSLGIANTTISETPEISLRHARLSNAKGRGANVGQAPARCHTCGFVFGSTRYTLMNARFRAGTSVQEICPACGSYDAYLEVGLMDFADSIVRLISAPEVTHEALAILLNKVKSSLAEATESEIKDPRELVRESFPNALPVPDKKWTRGDKLTAIGLLIAILTADLASDSTLLGKGVGLMSTAFSAAYHLVEGCCGSGQDTDNPSIEAPNNPEDGSMHDGPVEA